MKRSMRRDVLGAMVATAGVAAIPRPLLAQSGGGSRPVRIGVTAVFPDDEIALLRKWKAWLEARLQRPIEFVTRSSYRGILDLIRASQLDFAWVCGYPFVRYQNELKLVAVPVWQGKPLYRSYIIVAVDDARPQGLLDLSGRVFAFSDPDSNSGHLYPRYALIRAARDPETFFSRSFYTWAHRLVIRAVAEGVAQGGAVDGYVYDVVARLQPGVVARTRVIQRSPEFGHTPFVARRDIEAHEEQAFFDALAAMSVDPQGRELLNAMQLDGFTRGNLALFDSIAEMMRVDMHFRERRVAGRS
ncbi:MAG TPA: PhnD/SsuA/transferrin family substrate-binding protein [Burkholderiaceae bacterium]|nr:PhnD/SsuA/transferrin family substrate-binding protein [Burkholderiaceae bacterium]